MIDGAEFNIHTLYMTKENYGDMYAGKLTEVFIPIFSKRDKYSITIVGSLAHPKEATFKCLIQTPTIEHILVPTSLHVTVHQLRYSVPALASNSGIYEITCVVLYNDDLKGDLSEKMLSRSLMITFFKGLLR